MNNLPISRLGKTTVSLYIDRASLFILDRLCDELEKSRGDVVSLLLQDCFNRIENELHSIRNNNSDNSINLSSD
jgi:hypothetical protein